jgi:hypothetical protein
MRIDQEMSWRREDTAKAQHRAMGIARAWANLRAKAKPAEHWALDDDNGCYSNWGSVDAALADRLAEGHTTAVLRPVEQAWPSLSGMADWYLKSVNKDGGIPPWAEHAYQDEDVIFVRETRDERWIGHDLDDMLSATFRRWAEKHGDKVEINAWRWAGPAVVFAYADGRWINVSASRWMKVDVGGSRRDFLVAKLPAYAGLRMRLQVNYAAKRTVPVRIFIAERAAEPDHNTITIFDSTFTSNATPAPEAPRYVTNLEQRVPCIATWGLRITQGYTEAALTFSYSFEKDDVARPPS